jgi:hypothetical protein
MHKAKKTYGRVDAQIPLSLNLAIAGDELLASRPGRFTTGKTATVTR